MAGSQRLEGVQAERTAYVHESNRGGESAPINREASSEIGDVSVGHGDEHDRARLRLKRSSQPLDPVSGREQARRLTGGSQGPGEAPSNLASARDDQRRGQRPVGRSG